MALNQPNGVADGSHFQIGLQLSKPRVWGALVKHLIQTELSDRALCVLTVLWEYCKPPVPDGYSRLTTTCRVRLQTIRGSRSTRWASRGIAELKKAGLLNVTTTGRSNIYEIRIPFEASGLASEPMPLRPSVTSDHGQQTGPDGLSRADKSGVSTQHRVGTPKLNTTKHCGGNAGLILETRNRLTAAGVSQLEATRLVERFELIPVWTALVAYSEKPDAGPGWIVSALHKQWEFEAKIMKTAVNQLRLATIGIAMREFDTLPRGRQAKLVRQALELRPAARQMGIVWPSDSPESVILKSGIAEALGLDVVLHGRDTLVR